MKRLYIILMAALLVTSCSCERQAAILQKRCPDCFKTDTLHLLDTIAPEPVHIMEHVDWHDLMPGVPLTVEQRNYTLEIVVDDEGIDMSIDVTPDTVLLERDIPVTVPCEPCRDKTTRPWMLIAIIGAVALLLLFDTKKEKK